MAHWMVQTVALATFFAAPLSAIAQQSESEPTGEDPAAQFGTADFDILKDAPKELIAECGDLFLDRPLIKAANPQTLRLSPCRAAAAAMEGKRANEKAALAWKVVTVACGAMCAVPVAGSGVCAFDMTGAGVFEKTVATSLESEVRDILPAGIAAAGVAGGNSPVAPDACTGAAQSAALAASRQTSLEQNVQIYQASLKTAGDLRTRKPLPTVLAGAPGETTSSTAKAGPDSDAPSGLQAKGAKASSGNSPECNRSDVESLLKCAGKIDPAFPKNLKAGDLAAGYRKATGKNLESLLKGDQLKTPESQVEAIEGNLSSTSKAKLVAALKRTQERAPAESAQAAPASQTAALAPSIDSFDWSRRPAANKPSESPLTLDRGTRLSSYPVERLVGPEEETRSARSLFDRVSGRYRAFAERDFSVH